MQSNNHQQQQNKILSFYRQFITNPQLLANGHHLIKSFLLFSHTNRFYTLKNIFNTSNIPILTLINYIYPNQIFNTLSQDQKKNTRINLIQLLYQHLYQNPNPNPKNLQSLISFINHIHQHDGYAQWITLYTQLLVSQMNTNNPNLSQIHAFWILKILKSADDRIYPLSIKLFQFILQTKLIFTQQKTLEILYYSLKSLGHLYGTNDQQLQSIIPQINLVIQYIFNNSKSSNKAMRHSLRILSVLYSDFQQQSNQKIVNFVKQIGIIIANQLIKNNIASINSNSQQIEPYEALQDDQQMQQDSQTSAQLLFYQYLSLVQGMIEDQQQFFKCYYKILSVNLLFWLISVAVIPQYKAVKFWNKQQDQYVADVDDQGLRTLRNKGIQMLLSIIQQKNEVKKKVLQYLSKYLQVVIQGVNLQKQVFQNSMRKFYQQYNLNRQKIDQFILPHQFYEESAYFILYSFTDQILVNKQNKDALMKILMGRIQNQNLEQTKRFPLIKILALILINKFAKQISANSQNQAHYLNYLIKISSQETKNIGVIIIACRGIGSLCYRKNISILNSTSSNTIGIPIQLVFEFIQYVTNPNRVITADSAYIILQTLIKLSDGKNKQSFQNKQLLKQVFTKQRWWVLIKTYIHDGMTSSLIGKLLYQLANQELIKQIWENIKLNNAFVRNFQTFYELVANKIAQGSIKIRDDQLRLLIENYSRNLSIISRIVKQHLIQQNVISMLSQETVNVLNAKIHQSWILPLLNLNLLKDPENIMIKIVYKITNQISSQYEFQNHLLLPYSAILRNCQKTIQILNNNNIYDSFISKLIKYAKLFRGDSLKAVTSCVLINLCLYDPQWKQQVIDLIEGYGKLKNDEWQDQQQEQQDIVEQMMNFKIINEQVQRTMQNNFKDYAFNIDQIQTQLQKLKKST